MIQKAETVTTGKGSKRQRIGDYLIGMAKKQPGKLFSYREIAKEVFGLRSLPHKDDAFTRSVAHSGGSVRAYLQKRNIDLAVQNASMRALMTDEDKVRIRLPQTEATVASAHRRHAESVAIVDPRKLKKEDRESFENRFLKIAQFGQKIAGLLPTRKPDRD